MQLIKKISDKMYLIAGAIFLLCSIASLVVVKSTGIFISGVTLSLLCALFNYIYKVKWNALARESLLNACEDIKSFGLNLPLKILGSLQYLWIFLLILTFFKPVAIAFFPTLPGLVFTMINNVAFAFFIIGSFYQLLQGKLKGISSTTGMFAIYNLVDVVYSFVFEEHVLSTSSMCLFLAFWSIHRIFSIILCEKDPYEGVEEKSKKKEKPEKKKKLKGDKKEIEAENNVIVEDFINNKEENTNSNE